MQLGGVIALVEMMRENKRQRELIISLIDEQFLEVLLNLTTYQDLTMRQNATEFLLDLGDPRVIGLAPAVWSATDMGNENGLYNLAFVFKGSAGYVAISNKPTAINDLNSLLGTLAEIDRPKTSGLLMDAISLLSQ